MFYLDPSNHSACKNCPGCPRKLLMTHYYNPRPARVPNGILDIVPDGLCMKEGFKLTQDVTNKDFNRMVFKSNFSLFYYKIQILLIFRVRVFETLR